MSIRRVAAISMSVSELCTQYWVILVQSTISAKPGEAALHNPGEACDLERALPAFDDLQLPAVLAQQVARELATLVSGISDDCANVQE